MLSGLRWLALEVKSLDRARRFYADALDLTVKREGDREVVLRAGETELILRRPRAVPRGGIHTHFAFSIPEDEYDRWWDRLSRDHDLEEHQFGSAKSLYLYDPDGNCVELGQRRVDGEGIRGVFEVVLEVAELDRSEAFYTSLGFEVVDRGDDRRRVRLSGPVDLELWEPQLGIADGRGGVHVDLGFDTDDNPGVAVDAVLDRASKVTMIGENVRITDPDDHVLTFC
ncbi:fosmidomycin resistance protein [Halostella sp. JP-L12]|uniref:VOC family protein n=1 Tax=Halostella TaxID=1843185 RepID=UPI000EF7EB9B|nr:MULTISPECIES: VOC family protein [Halostella]NHN48697.1 fosmidomycin resistance protein [Halostella sp. JP-L12]